MVRRTLLLLALWPLATVLVAQRAQQLSSAAVFDTDTLQQVCVGCEGRRDLVLRDTIFHPRLRNEAGTLLPTPGVTVRSSALVLTLFRNPTLDALNDLPFDSVQVRVEVDLRTTGSEVRRESVTLRLYNSEARQTAKDVRIIPDVQWADVRVVGYACPTLFTEAQREAFKLHVQLLGTEDVVPRAAEHPPAVYVEPSADRGHLMLSWDALPWARSYDLEWSFVDATSGGEPDFRMRSTRVMCTDTRYELPLLFEAGSLYFRVRAVGVRPDGARMSGAWSPVSSPYVIAPTIAHERSTKVWQYTATYLDEGRRKDLVTYFDGSLRTRQQVTRLNEPGQPLVVTETIHDHEGRPAIRTIPAPVKPDADALVEDAGDGVMDLSGADVRPVTTVAPGTIAPGGGAPAQPVVTASPAVRRAATQFNASSLPGGFGGGAPAPQVQLPGGFTPALTPANVPSLAPPPGVGIDWDALLDYYSESPALRYIPSFSVDQEGAPYDRGDFDLVGPCSEESPAPMGTRSGAGRYFSPANDLNGTLADFVPDGEGYPFLQEVYTNDRTGRKAALGLAGDVLRIGGGHETRTYHAVPSQDELDRLFGNDAGDASLYTKVVVRDPNGQLTVQYINSKGQVVASGLTGEAPANLQAVERDATAAITLDVQQQMGRLAEDGEASLATGSFFIATDNTDVRLAYSLSPSDMRLADPCGTGPELCYDCPKELILRITDDCGGTVLSRRQRVGPQGEGSATIARCDPHPVLRIDTVMRLDQGRYHVHKELRIDRGERERYVDDLVDRDAACFRPEPGMPQCDEAEVCIPCRYTVSAGAVRTYKRLPDNDPRCMRHCPGGEPPFDVATYQSLLGDMLPGGQYGVLDPTDAKWSVSVFNLRNQLRSRADGTPPGFSYRSPAFPYLDPDGSEAWIDVTDRPVTDYATDRVRLSGGRSWVRPGDVLDLELLRERWVDSWTESLVAYHPEYAYFEWNTEQLASLRHDDRMRATATYEAALAAGFIDAGEVIDGAYLLRDPFFAGAPEATRTRMLDRLSRVATDPGGGPVALSIYGVAKQSVACNLPLHGADIAALVACMGAVRIADLDAPGRDAAWQLFRAIYLGRKAAVVDEQRTTDLGSTTHRLGGRLQNHCIETAAAVPGCLPCSATDALNTTLGGCTRRVLHVACMEGGRSPERDGMGRITGWTNALDATVRGTAAWMRCSNACPQAFDLMNLLNAVIIQGLLLERITFPAPPPLVIPNSLARSFPDPRSAGFTWEPVVDGNELTITIRNTGGVEQARFTLRKTDPTPWSDIVFLNCIKPVTGSTDHILFAYDREHRQDTLRLIAGSGLSLGPCPSVTIGPATLTRKANGDLSATGNVDLTDLPVVPCCVPLSPPARRDESCAASAARMAGSNADRAREERALAMRQRMTQAYTTACMSAAQERFTLSWSDPLYQVTLFYYDQAGNLIRSLPPAAVRPLADVAAVRSGRRGGAAVYPAHVTARATDQRFNAAGQVVQRITPDAGVTRVAYDRSGRLLLAQDADQRTKDRLSYHRYDVHGRPVEEGTATTSDATTPMLGGPAVAYTAAFLPAVAALTGQREVRTLHYDRAPTGTPSARFKEGAPRNLQGRMAAMRIRAEGMPTADRYDHALYVGYDANGNVTELVQDFASLSEVMGDPRLREDEVKVIRYQCDPVTGRVREVAYQPGAPDQFYHWYDHDADGRLTQVWTGPSPFEPSVTREREAAYAYYLHGPLARIEVGHENIQRKDFLHTINGWLKQINSASGDMMLDPSGDGSSSSPFPPDVLGLQYHYFPGDYSPARRPEAAGSASFIDHPALYNGIPSRITTRNAGLVSAPGGERTAALFTFDQLYRLTGHSMAVPAGGAAPVATSGDAPWDDLALMTWQRTDAHGMDIAFDRNGNITALVRRDDQGRDIDRATYGYAASSDRLDHIRDAAGAVEPGVDLDDQRAGNYAYDAKGRLTGDVAEGLRLSWNSRDQLVAAERRTGTMRYENTAHGVRSIVRDGESGSFTVRDLVGIPLATYDLRDGRAVLAELPLYGQSRLGTWRVPAGSTGSAGGFTHERGTKAYELSEQTGDVAALVSDRRLRVDVGGAVSHQPQVLMAEDHYPFGMVKPGRSMRAEAFAYGFGYHGMERDDRIKGDGRHYHTEFRQYDPRVGRWMSVDPKANRIESPYVAYSNDPVMMTDVRGDTALNVWDYNQLRDEVTRSLRTSDFNFNRDVGLLSDLRTRIGRSMATLSLLDRPREGHDPHRDARRSEQEVLMQLLREFANLSGSIERRIQRRMDERFGEPVTVNPYLAPPRGLGEGDRPAIGIDRGDGRPVNWFEQELEAVTSNPFSALVFNSVLASTGDRNAALRDTEGFNNGYDVVTGIWGLIPHGGVGGNEYEEDDRSIASPSYWGNSNYGTTRRWAAPSVPDEIEIER